MDNTNAEPKVPEATGTNTEGPVRVDLICAADNKPRRRRYLAGGLYLFNDNVLADRPRARSDMSLQELSASTDAPPCRIGCGVDGGGPALTPACL